MDGKPKHTLRSLMAAMGVMGLAPGWINPVSSAQKLHSQRGRAPVGRRWQSASVYMPGGPTPNVRGTYVKNPRIAADMNARHERIEEARNARG